MPAAIYTTRLEGFKEAGRHRSCTSLWGSTHNTVQQNKPQLIKTPRLKRGGYMWSSSGCWRFIDKAIEMPLRTKEGLWLKPSEGWGDVFAGSREDWMFIWCCAPGISERLKELPELRRLCCAMQRTPPSLRSKRRGNTSRFSGKILQNQKSMLLLNYLPVQT